MRLKATSALFAVWVCLPALAHAQYRDPSSIFDRSARSISPPPANLSSREEAPHLRYAQSDIEPGYQGDGSELDRVEVSTPHAPSEIDREADYRDSGAASFNRAAPVSSSRATLRPGFDGKRVFGLGLVSAGHFGVFGVEAEISPSETWAFGAGIGTGLSYSTWALLGRYYFAQDRISPYVGFSYANWTLRRAPASGRKAKPEYISSRFFEKDSELLVGRSRHLISPSVGVLFQDQSGIALSVQIQYLISLQNTNGALYGSAGAYFYF